MQKVKDVVMQRKQEKNPERTEDEQSNTCGVSNYE